MYRLYRRNLKAANHAAEPRVNGIVLDPRAVFSDCNQSSIAMVRIKVRVWEASPSHALLKAERNKSESMQPSSMSRDR